MAQITSYSFLLVKGFRISVVGVISILMLLQPAYALSQPIAGLDQSVLQTADILDVRAPIEQLLVLNENRQLCFSDMQQMVDFRGLLLKRILHAYLDVRAASNKIDCELAYAYELSQREEQRLDKANQLFNFVNFMQAGTLYTIEGRSKLHKQDKQSYILTTLGAGLSTALPASNILYKRNYRATHLAPPKELSHLIDGGPVNEKDLPECLKKFLRSTVPGASCTRLEQLNQLWKQRYKADWVNDATLCSLLANRSENPGVIKKRILLLWSLHTVIAEFDRELLALLELVRSKSHRTVSGIDADLCKPVLGQEASGAARLLKLEVAVSLLAELRGKPGKQFQALFLELEILEQVLWGLLNVQTGVNKVDSELNYAYDVVLAELLSNRRKLQQGITEANFINKGALNAVGGFLDLKTYKKAADSVFVTANGIGIGLTSFALLKAGGGRRKIDTAENSLAELFGLAGQSQEKLPLLVRQFLDMEDPASGNGKSRREALFEIWKKNRVSTMNTQSLESQRALAALSKDSYDTIKIVTNRIALLQSLRVRISSLNRALLSLLHETEFEAPLSAKEDASACLWLSEANKQIAAIIGVRLPSYDDLMGNGASPVGMSLKRQELYSLSRILLATLEVRNSSANVEVEIATETQALNRLLRSRDLAVTLTNNANFYQGYILATILYGPLGLSSYHENSIYADRLKIIAGFLTIGLGAVSLLEHHGGFRLHAVKPNMLGLCFDLKSSAQAGYEPFVWQYFNSLDFAASVKISRKDELVRYWRSSKLLDVNLGKRTTIEKVAATGRSHHKVDETIKLTTNRVAMLYDLRAMLNSMDQSLSNLLGACR
jgi:hypothetical protein